ncbi:MAG: hypothetical protein K0R02_863 [Rickettsiaceae bacterium]|jgi:ATPase subunit of ABC transporter with duplicated ATPase domains|nr:hypothetical protein [Rickettsiaceae bacterium]
MIHNPIIINKLSLEFPSKTCFEDFTAQIYFGSRIAIIGRNGSGKSSLLRILSGEIKADIDKLIMPYNGVVSYIPQIIDHYGSLSGGERLTKALDDTLSIDPNILLLDEPTNHLDAQNRKFLFKKLNNYRGTLIIVSHDTELLRSCTDILWHIDEGKIHIFTGSYEDYLREMRIRKEQIEDKLTSLNKQKKDAHNALMKEQKRAKNSRQRGEKSIEQRKWPTIVSHAKAHRAETTTGRLKSNIALKKDKLLQELSNIRLAEVIKPKFSLSANMLGSKSVVSINQGSCGYDKPILENINLYINATDRLSIKGNNGSGKTTLVKAILNDSKIIKTGTWLTPRNEDIGYLDQHYHNLNLELTVLENITNLVPSWNHAEVRRHLNDFLFRSNEEVNCKTYQLSGGEKARLSLAQIAAKTPKLLILDEITNNIDLETREHIIQVLKEYPGAMIVISHDEDFLKEINIDFEYNV